MQLPQLSNDTRHVMPIFQHYRVLRVSTDTLAEMAQSQHWVYHAKSYVVIRSFNNTKSIQKPC